MPAHPCMNAVLAMMLASSMAIGVAIAAETPAGDPKAPLGSPSFVPSPEHPIGWRGDGSGRYPGALNPLTVWGRTIHTPLETITCQLQPPPVPAPDGATTAPAEDKPAPDAAPINRLRGGAAFHFAISQWLVLGPLEPKNPSKALEEALLPDAGKAAPKEGDKVGELTWKKVQVPQWQSVADLTETMGDSPRKVAYACTYFYCPRDMQAGIRAQGLTHGYAFRAWLNGKEVGSWDGTAHPLPKGLNRLVVQFQAHPPLETQALKRGQKWQWQFGLAFFPFPGAQTTCEDKNIVWATPMPGPSMGMPIIVSDKIYTLADPNDLVCLDKATGKILWMKANPLYDIAAIDAKNGIEIKGDRAALAASRQKLDELNAAYVQDASKVDNAARRKLALDLTDAIRRNNKRYPEQGEWGGGNAVCTPTSDGKFIYAWFGETGMLTCFDLEGHRQWVSFQHCHWGGGHGVNSSPVLVGDRIVMLGPCRMWCFDKSTGKLVWELEKLSCWAHPTVVAAKVGADDVVVTTDGTVVSVKDGKILARAVSAPDSSVPSAVVDGQRFYTNNARGVYCHELARTGDENPPVKQVYGLSYQTVDPVKAICPMASPLIMDGLLYTLHSGYAALDEGRMYVLDAADGKVVYKQSLDYFPCFSYDGSGGGATACVTAAGKYIYTMDNRGTMIVFTAGRQFNQVARNTIEDLGSGCSQSPTLSTPIFEGTRMYYRGYDNLYCIGEK